MESFIDNVARTFNGISTTEQAIGEAKRNAEKFRSILANRVVNKVEEVVNPEKDRKDAMNAIKDFEGRDRPEAGNVTNEMVYQNMDR